MQLWVVGIFYIPLFSISYGSSTQDVSVFVLIYIYEYIQHFSFLHTHIFFLFMISIVLSTYTDSTFITFDSRSHRFAHMYFVLT